MGGFILFACFYMPMTRKPNTEKTAIDEVDRRILGILAENPRLPYSEISERLAEQGFELSGEAVRQRTTSLFEITSNFFLVRPESHDWELVLVTVKTKRQPSVKAEVFKAMSEMAYWYVGSGLGTIDLYGFATVGSNTEVEQLLDQTRNQSAVTDVDYFIETKHSTDIEEYLQTV
jgi:DNA-binding Lrp family transcriptional regulator